MARTGLNVADSANARDWTRDFLRENSIYDSVSILLSFDDLTAKQKQELRSCAVAVLSNAQLRRNESLRNGAVRLTVALLPETFGLLEKLLSDVRSSMWHEVHFTVFSSLERSDLSKYDQQRVLSLVERYLANASSEAGYAAWKAGDMLGDEWNSPETVEILKRLVFSARHVGGRAGALHGLQHAMEKATPAEESRLLLLVRQLAEKDRSAAIRNSARLTLQGSTCYTGARRRKEARKGKAAPRVAKERQL